MFTMDGADNTSVTGGVGWKLGAVSIKQPLQRYPPVRRQGSMFVNCSLLYLAVELALNRAAEKALHRTGGCVIAVLCNHGS